MENNQSNITEETKHNDNLETTYEQTQQKEKTFSQEEVSQMKNETRSMLNESGLENFDDQIVNILVNTDAEKTRKNVESFTNLLNQMVKSNVEKALRQDSPVSTQSNKMTKDEESDYLVSGRKCL